MTTGRRQTSIVILVAAVAVALLSQNLVGIALSVGIAVIAGLFLLIPPSFDFYVEVDGESLVVKRLVTARIQLRDIRSVELTRPNYPPVKKGIANFFLMLGNLFGANHDLVGDPDAPFDLAVRFRKRIWVLIMLPPFVLPRRNWVLMVERAESLQEEINRRLDAGQGIHPRASGTEY